MSEADKYSRLIAIYGEEKLKRLKNSNVAVIGLGGVGSYCVAALTRSGIGTLTICDFDVVEESNINRQLFATEETISRKKTEVASDYLNKINSKAEIKAFAEKLDDTNASEILNNADYIVDAIDDVNAKITIAKYAEDKDIPIVSCMGTAMKTDPSRLKFADIYKTDTCPLCKNVRKLAKEAGIKKLEVLYSDEPSLKSKNGQMGSTSYLPPIAGLMLAGKVIDAI